MENNIIVALIGGAASILSAVITALVTLAKAPGQKLSMAFLRHKGFLIATLIFAVLAAVVAGFVFHVFGIKSDICFSQNELMPGAKYEGIARNASITIELDRSSPKLPDFIPVYHEGSPPINMSSADLKLDQSLVYQSTFAQPNNSYTICRFIADKSFNVQSAHGVRLILWAKDDDKVELSLKDHFNVETTPPLSVHKNWGAYEIPFDLFNPVSLTKVVEFHIAFTCGLEGKNSNILRIAKIAMF